jgi:CRP-like cAMP-binding protein
MTSEIVFSSPLDAPTCRGLILRPSITQAELADATGPSAVHVNRSVQSLRRNQLISFRAGSLTVMDWPSAAGFNPDYLHITPVE